jgi:hypothetical protein
MTDSHQAQELKALLDRIAQAKDNPEQIQQMVNEAKSKVDQFVQQQSGQPPQPRQAR